jgi:dTDP-4-amino-4,6-dideoxygalactose transaminase
MRPIQMVDLKQQYSKIKKEVDGAIQEVIDSAAFISGKAVTDFADGLSKYLGIKHVIPCANGTDALQISMMALDLQPGDEVITPSFTYIATTEVVALLRLKPVFVDVDPKHFVLTLKLLKSNHAKNQAIVPVHLYGHSAKMDEIMQIAPKIGYT